MTKPLQIDSGAKFGKLTTVRPVRVLGNKHTLMECVCSCGQFKVVRCSALLSGNSTSCGCNRRQKPYPTKLSFDERVVLTKLLGYPTVWMPRSDPEIHTANRLTARGLVEYTEEGFCGYVITPAGRKAHTPRKPS